MAHCWPEPFPWVEGGVPPLCPRWGTSRRTRSSTLPPWEWVFAVLQSLYIEWLALGAIAVRVPGKLLWDGNQRRFTNSDPANRLLKPALRKGWDLKV